MTPTETLIDALKRLYPGTAAGVDWVVVDGGAGPVVQWCKGSGPTTDEILASELPPPVVKWTPDKFRDRFTAQELVAIKRASETNDNVALLEIKLFTASEIVSNAASTIGGMALLVQAGILSQDRADAILRTT